jgi:modulator of FtsH protease HflK
MSKLLRAIFSLNDPGWGRSKTTPPSSTPEAQGEDHPESKRPEADRPPTDRPAADRPKPNRPSGSKDGPPDLDELWRDFNRKLNSIFGKGKGSGNLPRPSGNNNGGGPDGPGFGGAGGLRGAGIGIGVIALGALLLWLASGVFIIQEGQTAAVLRFGELDRTRDQAGITWRMPFPIEAHEVINTQQLRTVEVGYRQVPKNKLERESQMLTMDQSIVDMQVAIQYRISDAKAFFFNNNISGNPEELARQAAEAAMREIVGRRTIDQVLYEEKEGVAKDARILMQKLVDRYGAGITVIDVTVQQAQPPEKVQAAFEDANKAAQDKENFINEGRSYANDVIPRARGAAARLMQEADGYKEGLVATATGDGARFNSILTEYSKAPQVTRERMYLETMQSIFSNTSKIYVDSKSGGSLLNLPLDKLMGVVGDVARPVAAPTPGIASPPVTPEPRSEVIDTRREAVRTRDRDSGRP